MKRKRRKGSEKKHKRMENKDMEGKKGNPLGLFIILIIISIIKVMMMMIII